MPPLTNIFGSDDDEPFEPGSYLPLQPIDEDGDGADDGLGADEATPTPAPLLGSDEGDLPPASEG